MPEPKQRDISEYILIGNVNLKQARKLHALTTKYKESLFHDKTLTRILLNEGYEFDGPTPTSYFGVFDHTFNRTKTILHLIKVLKNSAIRRK